MTLNNISQIYDAWGRYDEALKRLEGSLSIFREVRDRAGEAVTSWSLSFEYERRGDLARAVELARKTVQIERDTQHPDLAKDLERLEKLEAQIGKVAPGA